MFLLNYFLVCLISCVFIVSNAEDLKEKIEEHHDHEHDDGNAGLIKTLDKDAKELADHIINAGNKVIGGNDHGVAGGTVGAIAKVAKALVNGAANVISAADSHVERVASDTVNAVSKAVNAA